MSETTHPDNHSAYHGVAERCFSCQAIAREQAQWRGVDDHVRGGLLFGVEKR